MSFKMGVKFAASFYMGKNLLQVLHVFFVKVLEVNYNQYEDKLNQQKVSDNRWHAYIINSLLSPPICINYMKGPFIMDKFYTRRCHSKWVHFQIPDPPPPPPPRRPPGNMCIYFDFLFASLYLRIFVVFLSLFRIPDSRAGTAQTKSTSVTRTPATTTPPVRTDLRHSTVHVPQVRPY